MSEEKSLNVLFHEHLPEVVAQIKTDRDQIIRDGWQSGAVSSLYHTVHKLVGSSGVLGYVEICQSARAIEGKINPEKEPFLETISFDELKQMTNNLLQAIETDQPSQPELKDPVVKKTGGVDRSGKLIYLVEDDAIQAFELVVQIENYGYRVKVLPTLDSLNDSVKQRRPDTILIGIDFPEGLTAGPDKVNELRAKMEFDIPVVFLSSTDNFSFRLSAVRAGGQAYFIKPVDIIALIDVLDQLTQTELQEPYRILLVEDSKFQAAYYARVLGNEGMQTRVCTEPSEVLEVMADFNPDLILLDMYMPECSGMELANLVRQVERFVSIPIVYLSAERDVDVQLLAMSHGGDDFLSKPIKPDHLIASVRTRVIRYRRLRLLMLRDGLTGLLNHTTINEYLDQEIARAKRQNTSVSFVMIDLDKFKQVNDTYGHPAGDRVLKSLSRLLKQRLRRADVIGRYGGEEFSLILPDTTAENARYVMEDIRRRFNKIVHSSGDQHFTVSFSGGIASYPLYSTANEIKEAADQALYQAKRAGRDQVVLSKPAGK